MLGEMPIIFQTHECFTYTPKWAKIQSFRLNSFEFVCYEVAPEQNFADVANFVQKSCPLERGRPHMHAGIMDVLSSTAFPSSVKAFFPLSDWLIA